VLALETADTSTVGAVAGSLEQALGIGNTQVGFLVAVTMGIGAIATLPAGVLIDRVTRTRVLWISILIWGVAMVTSGASVSFLMLVLSRLALGAVVATATPAVASLVGDFFPAGQRGAIWSYILLGELVGAGIGYLVGGTVAGPLSWRASFWILAAPALFLTWGIQRMPEPARGGVAQMPSGTERVPGQEGLPQSSDGAPAAEQGASEVAAEIESKASRRTPSWCSPPIPPTTRSGGRCATCSPSAPTCSSSPPRHWDTSTSPGFKPSPWCTCAAGSHSVSPPKACFTS
jgi:MFS family permease